MCRIRDGPGWDLLLTMLAVNPADQLRFRRALLREMVDQKEVKAAEPPEPGPVVSRSDGD